MAGLTPPPAEIAHAHEIAHAQGAPAPVCPPPRADIAQSPRSIPLIDGCQGCGACLLTCPETAIRPSGGTLLVLDDRCTGCGECIEVCPVDAISWKDGPA